MRSSAAPAAPKPCRLRDCAQPQAGQGYCDDHLRQRMPSRWQALHKIAGRAEPRWATEPLRQLTRKTSRGYEVIDFAEMIGQPLLPWQQRAVIRALELLPDGSYRFRTVLIVVARQNGKSQLARTVTLWRMYIDGARKIIGVAQDVTQARDQWKMCQDAIHDCPDLQAEWGGVRNVNGDEKFWAAGCVYAIKAANRRAGRGGSNDLVVIDELREQQSWDAWGAVSKTTMARTSGQVWAMSNAGDDSSVVLNQLMAAAKSGQDSSICLLEWSAPEDCELDDEAAWAQANPGLGHTVAHAAIRSAMLTDTPGVFRTEVLCQRVDQLDGAIDLAAWRACHDPQGDMSGLRDRIAACLDVAPDGQHATLVVAGKLPDGRIRLEAAGQWKSTEEARDELPELLARIKPAAFAWFPIGPAAALAPVLRPVKDAAELTGGKVTEACQHLADIVKARRVLHPGDPLINAHISGARKLASGDGWRFTRRGGVGHVDGAYAAAGAVYLAATMEEPRKAVFRSFSL